MQFAITPLTPEKCLQVLPLIQSISNDITAEQWQNFVTATLADSPGESGIITVKNAADYYMGVFCYRIAGDALHDKVMEVTYYVAADILGRNDISESLLNWIEGQAKIRGCSAVHITLDLKEAVMPKATYGQSIPSQLANKGYVCDATRLCKRLS